MLWFLLKRVSHYLLVLVGLSILVFIISRVIPGDPARLALGPRVPEEIVQRLEHKMNLDKPIHIQYVLWIKGLLHGDFGESLQTRRPVTQDVREFLPATLEIVMFSGLIIIVGSIVLGVLSAKFMDTWFDGFSRIIAYTGIVAPEFVWAVLLMFTFCYLIPIFPITGRLSPGIISPKFITGIYTIDGLLRGSLDISKDAFMHLILPSVSLSLGALAQGARITRSSMVGNMTKDYALLQKAYGVPERVIFFKYLLKPSIIPTISIMGLDIAFLVAKAFLVELIFNFPGISRYGVQAMLNKDLNAVTIVIMILGCLFILVNIIIDIIVAFVDPRIRLMGRSA